MPKNKGNEIATYTPQPQTQYMPAQYAPPAYMPPAQPYVPKTSPINPSVSPANPSMAVLADDSVIIAPKKPPRSLRPLSLKAIFLGLIILILATFLIFMTLTIFYVDSWNPFRIIVDFFTEFDFGKFFREFFTGS